MEEFEQEQKPVDESPIRPSLSFVILCDAVGAGPDGRKTLYGLFTKLHSRTFPFAYPSLAIVTRWSTGYGAHTMRIAIMDSQKNEVFKTTTPFGFKLDNPLVSTDIVLTIQNFIVPKPGSYRIHVWLDNETNPAESSFFVEKL